MEVGKLTVQRRTQTGKGVARKLRREGKIPGVCYGYKVDEAVPVSVDVRALQGSLDPARRHNTVIDVTIQDDGQPDQNLVVMVTDYQIDKIRRELIHVDLQAIDTEKEVEVAVPLEFTGKAKGLVLGGTLHVVRHELEVRCKPGDIPAKVDVSVTDLDIGGVIHVSDLTMPPGVTAVSSGHLTIITCVAPEGAEEETTEEGAEAAAPAA